MSDVKRGDKARGCTCGTPPFAPPEPSEDCPHHAITPEGDLPKWLHLQWDSGVADADPFSFAAVGIRVLLEYALDDGISGAMNAEEYHSLELIAHLLSHLTDQTTEPRPA